MIFCRDFPDGSLVVNVSRGSVAVTEDILRHAGRLEFALDVTEPEPLPETHPLWSTPGVFITPHIGGDTDAFPRLARQLIGQQVERWRNDQPLRNATWWLPAEFCGLGFRLCQTSNPQSPGNRWARTGCGPWHVACGRYGR